MNNLFLPILWQMIFLFAFIILGYALAKTKVLPDNSAPVLSKLENFIFVPALVMNTFIKNGNLQTLSTAWKFLVCGAVLTLILIPISFLIVRMCFKDKYLQKQTAYGLIFSNFGFMGNAVMSAVFPEIFFQYTLFTLPMWFLIYLWGVPTLLIGGEKEIPFKNKLKSFFNPMLICMFIGLIIGLINITLPQTVYNIIEVSADCMSPIAMVLTGIVIAKINIKSMIKKWQLYCISAIRLILFPLIFILIFLLVPKGSFITINVLICGMCVLSMPMGLNAIVVPLAYEKDTSYSASLVLLTSLLSVLTIPLMFMLFSALIV